MQNRTRASRPRSDHRVTGISPVEPLGIPQGVSRYSTKETTPPQRLRRKPHPPFQRRSNNKPIDPTPFAPPNAAHLSPPRANLNASVPPLPHAVNWYFGWSLLLSAFITGAAIGL